MTKVTYDERCFDLAALFLSDEPLLADRVEELAALIQVTIEDFIGYERSVAEAIEDV